VLIQRTRIFQSRRKSYANAKNEHGEFMTVQRTRTTAPKDSADKSTLMRKMKAGHQQSSIAQDSSIVHCDYEERIRRMKKNQMKKHHIHGVVTIPHPRSISESRRTEEKRRRTETESPFAIKHPPAKLGAQCRHSDFANNSPGSERSEASMTSS
jgi:hypothetical protein